MTGIITTFFHDKGYGFARGEDGKDYFLHIKEFTGETDLNKIVRNEKISFTPFESVKGYQATKISILQTYSPLIDYHQPKNREKNTSRTGAEVHYVEPDSIFFSKEMEIRGWDVLHDSGWFVCGHTSSAGEAPDNAKQEMLNKARAIGANAVVGAKYVKTTGSSGNYNFSLHHQTGRAVIIGKQSSNGVTLESLNRDMNGIATALYGEAEKNKESSGLWIFVIILAIAVAAMVIIPSSIGSEFKSIVIAIIFIVTSLFGWGIHRNCCSYILDGYIKG